MKAPNVATKGEQPRSTRVGWPDSSQTSLRGRQRRLPSIVAGVVAAFALIAPPAAEAQAFKIGWFTVDGGGGTSSGGGISISGTAGQSDAGKLEGGPFTVIGGFWGITQAIQTPGAPRLNVSRDGLSGVVTVAWTLPDDGWVLVESPTLGQSPTPWVLVSPVKYQTNATHRFIEIPNPTGRKFYRLSRP